jgi:enoyl-CoA hydratase/carnithine racemase
MIETDQLLFERREPVAYITFNRPEAHNAMTRLEVAPLREVADWVEQYRRFW